MDYHKLNILVDRFWEGKTSDKDEEILKSYFEQEDYLKEFQSTADYFKYVNKERIKFSLNDDFDEKILRQLPPKKENSGLGLFLRIAAGIALIFSLYFGFQSISGGNTDQFVIEDSFDNPEQAYIEVKKALLLVSGKMNEGTAYGNELKKFNHANKSIRYEKDIKQ